MTSNLLVLLALYVLSTVAVGLVMAACEILLDR